jgi:GNAT superfamily N-acetyltransferase
MTIRQVSYSEILGASNAEDLLGEYAAECSLPQIGTIQPQGNVYAALEELGAIKFLGVFVRANHPLDPEELVGLASLLVSVLPHYSRKVATVESLFVASAHRSSGAGLALMSALEQLAADEDCEAILISAPAHGKLAKVLEVSHNYVCTNIVYCRRLG